MSKKIIGTVCPQKVKNYDQTGAHGVVKKMSINIKSINGQRPTVAKRVEYLLDKEGGFNWSLFQPVLIAKIKELGEYRLIDGDHRRHMIKTVMPNSTHIFSHVIDLDTEREGNDLFEKINKSRKTSVSQEDLFFNKYKAGDPEAIKLSKILGTLKMRVTSQPDTSGVFCVPDGSSDPAIGISPFKKAYAFCNKNILPIQRATDLLHKNFGDERKFASELFQGLCMFFNLYDHQFTKSKKTYDEFEKWFLATCFSQKKSSTWKKLGGGVHNKEAESIAKGMLIDFRTCASKTANKLLIMRIVNDSIDD